MNILNPSSMERGFEAAPESEQNLIERQRLNTVYRAEQNLAQTFMMNFGGEAKEPTPIQPQVAGTVGAKVVDIAAYSAAKHSDGPEIQAADARQTIAGVFERTVDAQEAA